MHMKRATVDWQVCGAETVHGIIFFKIGEVCCWTAKHVRTGFLKKLQQRFHYFVFFNQLLSFLANLFECRLTVGCQHGRRAYPLQLNESCYSYFAMLVVQQVLKKINQAIIHDGQVSSWVKCSFVCLQIKCGQTHFIKNKLFLHPQLLFNFEPVMLKRDFINKVLKLKLYAIFT